MINENVVEESIIALLQKIGYEYVENDDWILNRQLDEFIDESLLKRCLVRINSVKDPTIIDEAIKTIFRIDNPSLFERNRQFHEMLTEGITVEDKDYAVNPLIRLIDFD